MDKIKIAFNATMPDLLTSDMVSKAVREYMETGIFPEELEDIFKVDIKLVDDIKLAIVNWA